MAALEQQQRLHSRQGVTFWKCLRESTAKIPNSPHGKSLQVRHCDPLGSSKSIFRFVAMSCVSAAFVCLVKMLTSYGRAGKVLLLLLLRYGKQIFLVRIYLVNCHSVICGTNTGS